jgi:hypothetical protein
LTTCRLESTIIKEVLVSNWRSFNVAKPQHGHCFQPISGHFTTTFKDCDCDTWFHADDNNVTACDPPAPVMITQTYVYPCYSLPWHRNSNHTFHFLRLPAPAFSSTSASLFKPPPVNITPQPFRLSYFPLPLSTYTIQHLHFNTNLLKSTAFTCNEQQHSLTNKSVQTYERGVLCL